MLLFSHFLINLSFSYCVYIIHPHGYLTVFFCFVFLNSPFILLFSSLLSRHWLEHPLCPAGPALCLLALQIQDGKTSAGHLGAAVGLLLLSLGWVSVFAHGVSCKRAKKAWRISFKSNYSHNKEVRPLSCTHAGLCLLEQSIFAFYVIFGHWFVFISGWQSFVFTCLVIPSHSHSRCPLHCAANLHVLHRLLAYCCHVHRVAHCWLEHPETRQETEDISKQSLLSNS